MWFAMWGHTGNRELYKDETALSALILGQVGKEPNKSVYSLPHRGPSKSSIELTTLPLPQEGSSSMGALVAGYDVTGRDYNSLRWSKRRITVIRTCTGIYSAHYCT